MDRKLEGLLERAEEKMGVLGQYAKPLLHEIKIKLSEEDVVAARARVVQFREGLLAQGRVADKVEAILADDAISIHEIGEFALELEAALDELEDVFRGFDEDDTLTPASG